MTEDLKVLGEVDNDENVAWWEVMAITLRKLLWVHDQWMKVLACGGQ